MPAIDGVFYQCSERQSDAHNKLCDLFFGQLDKVSLINSKK